MNIDPVTRRVDARLIGGLVSVLLAGGAVWLIVSGVQDESTVRIGLGLVLLAVAIGLAVLVVRKFVRKGSTPTSKAAPVTSSPSQPLAPITPGQGVVPPPPGLVTPPPAFDAPDESADPDTLAKAPSVTPQPPADPEAEPWPMTERRATPAPVAPDVTWTLSAEDGTTQEIGGELLVGRDPGPGLVTGATTWRVVDPELSMSKTHALFGLDGASAWVEDWASTNGTVLRRDGGEAELMPHDRRPLFDGDEVLLGDVVIHVRRA